MASKTKADIRREDLRERLWPGTGDLVWTGSKERGYFCAPRVLPLVLSLMNDRKLFGKPDCARVYLEILARGFDQGIVEVQSEQDHAFFAGYTSSRAVRTWRERIGALERVGFIKVAPRGNRRIGYVLVIHHLHVVSALYKDGKVDQTWWNLYIERLREVGARLPRAQPSQEEVEID